MHIVPLHHDAVSNGAFGRKAQNLAILQNCVEGLVPLGFCVSHEADLTNKKIESAIAKYCKEICNTSGKMIVRSSALFEDLAPLTFAGRFESVRNSDDVASVIQAIIAVRNSAASPRVVEYLQEIGIEETPKVACIVQRQVNPDCSGVLFSRSPLDENAMMLEITMGEGSGMLRGYRPARTYHLYRNQIGNEDNDIVVESLTDRGRPAGITFPIEKLIDILERDMPSVFGPTPEGINLEWCAVNRSDGEVELSILQAREVKRKAQKPPTGLQRHTHKENADKTVFPDGTKAYATMWFSRLELGPPNLLTIRRNQPEPEVKALLQNYKRGTNGTTIRFSDPKSSIGLRRDFVDPKEDLWTSFHRARGRKSYFGIIHDYLSPDHSFEVYLDESFTVIEHVPGIWESESTITPDVIILEHGEQPILLRCIKPRSATLKRPGYVQNIVVDPIPLQTFKTWIAILQRRFRKLRHSFPREVPIPVNLHFIGTLQPDESLRFSFLNLRLSTRLSIKAPKSSAFHVVNSIRDLGCWDGKVALLVRVPVDRGNERQALVPIAKAIRTIASQPTPEAQSGSQPYVYVEFGLLSHPAIVLREFGIEVRPLFNDHETIILAN